MDFMPFTAFARRHPHVQKAQVAASLRFAPWATLAGALFAAALACTMWNPELETPIGAWLGAIALVATARLSLWALRAGKRHGRIVPDRDARMIAILSAIEGSAWGLALGLFATGATAEQFPLIALMTGLSIGILAFAGGPLLRASIAGIVPLTAGCLAAWLITPGAATPIACVLIGLAAALSGWLAAWRDALFAARVEAGMALRDTTDTIALLRNCTGSPGADWTWSIDSRGRVTRPSPMFAEASGHSRGRLESMAFADLFVAGPERDLLAARLGARLPVSALTLQPAVEGAPRWWSVSARPGPDGGMRGVAADITASVTLAQAQAQAAATASRHDRARMVKAAPATGRDQFLASLSGAVARLGAGETLALLLFDLDRFKAVNDALGHAAGNRVLEEAARRIASEAGHVPLVSSLGGDEFAVLVQSAHTARDAQAMAQGIIAAIEQPFDLDGLQAAVTVSVGMVLAGGADRRVDATALVQRAELALYAAKSGGGNALVRFRPAMSDKSRERRELERELRTALAQGQITLDYQPLVDLTSGATRSRQAQAHWSHPVRGDVPASLFLPLAEETGLIVGIGEWAIRQAARDAAQWPDDIRVTVPLAPVQLRSSSLVATIVGAVASSGIAPERFEIEVPDAALAQDSAAIRTSLNTLRVLGVRIALSGVGAGYGSLNHLRAFPFDRIAIDPSLVEDIAEREDCGAIVRAAAGLARSLRMDVTAVGIESTEQAERLRAAGCNEGQGPLFGRLAAERATPRSAGMARAA